MDLALTRLGIVEWFHIVGFGHDLSVADDKHPGHCARSSTRSQWCIKSIIQVMKHVENLAKVLATRSMSHPSLNRYQQRWCIPRAGESTGTLATAGFDCWDRIARPGPSRRRHGCHSPGRGNNLTRSLAARRCLSARHHSLWLLS